MLVYRYANKCHRTISSAHSHIRTFAHWFMAIEQHIQRIEEKLLLLLKKLQQEQADNASLKEQLQLQQQESTRQLQTIAMLEEKLHLAKIAGVASGKPATPEEDEDFKKEMRNKINDYIKEIDRCIALLNS